MQIVLFFSSIICTSLYIYNSENKRRMLLQFIVYATVSFFCQSGIRLCLSSTPEKTILAFFLSALCLLFPFVVSLCVYLFKEKANDYDNKQHFLELILALSINAILLALSLCHLSAYLKEINDAISDSILDLTFGLSSAIIFWLITPYIRKTFCRIKSIEYAKDENGNNKYSTKQVDVAKLSQYLIYTSAFISGTAILYHALAYSFRSDPIPLIYYCMLFSIIIMVLFCCYGIKHWKNFSFCFYIISYLVIFGYLLHTAMNLKSDSFSNVGLLTMLLILYLACGISIFTTLSTLFNIDLLRLRSASEQVLKSALTTGISGGLCFGFAAYQLIVFPSLFCSFQLLIISTLSFCILPYFHATALNSNKQNGILNNHPYSGVGQDGFLFSIIITANTMITAAIRNQWLSRNHLNAVLIFIAFSVGLFPLWMLCIENNEEHLRKMAEKRDALLLSPSSNSALLREQYDNLKSFIKIQNLFGLLLAFPYSFLFIIKQLMDNEDCKDKHTPPQENE